MPTLFWNFLIIKILEVKFNSKNNNAWLILPIAVTAWRLLKDVNLMIPYLDVRYLLWFVIGYEFESIREKIKKNVSGVVVIISVFCWALLSFVLPKPSELLTLVSVCNMYIICIALSERVNVKKIRSFLKYSFPIYLFHDPLNVLILKGIDVWNLYYLYETAWGICLLIAVRMVLPVSVSILLSKVLNKYNRLEVKT